MQGKCFIWFSDINDYASKFCCRPAFKPGLKGQSKLEQKDKFKKKTKKQTKNLQTSSSFSWLPDVLTLATHIPLAFSYVRSAVQVLLTTQRVTNSNHGEEQGDNFCVGFSLGEHKLFQEIMSLLVIPRPLIALGRGYYFNTFSSLPKKFVVATCWAEKLNGI